MHIHRSFAWILSVAGTGGLTHASVQTTSSSVLVTPRISDTSIFAPLTLPPAPSPTRSASGAPGPKYWQNRADYDLKVTLDTVTGTIQGSMVLRYTNNSPNTLDVIWVQTEQNRIRPDPDATNSSPPYGDVIDQFTQVVKGRPAAVQLEDHKSETKVMLPAPLKRGETATFQVAWHFLVPPSTRPLGRRMGRSGSLYQIAQWYPRLNVYDDVKGWNIEPYLGNAEFFLDYGDFTMEVTVPSNYVVAATGTLDNPRDVLTAAEIARLAQAAKADTIIRIVTAEELANGAAHLRHDGMVTWKFHAKNVRDAVWCASPQYQWDATSWHGIITQSYYRTDAASAWHESADMVRMSIQEYSERWYQYPYPQVSAVEGPVNGDEYPMLSMDGDESAEVDLYNTITHETGHNWFPMIVGSNERMHAWMDEGFNTFVNSFSNARRYPAQGDQNARIGEWVADEDGAVLEDGTPIGNTSPQYMKTAKVLQVLRRDVMGPDVFDKAFRTYIQQWAYKHPTPMDFFRTMANAYGHNLDWFWRECFLEAPKFDQAIDSVRQAVEGTDTHVSVTYGNKGRMVMPLFVRFTFSDSTTQDVTYPADVWKTNSTAYTVSYTFPKKTVSRIVLDPDTHLPDADRSNNTWITK
jgi:hypothetical protein